MNHFRLHSLIILSELPDANVLPLVLKLTALTYCSWPDNVLSNRNGFKFHSLIILSKPPDAKLFPSGLNLTE